MMYLKSSYTSYQGETNLLVFYVVLVDLELEHEGAAPGSTSQPVRRNISLKLKAKSNSASSLSSGKSKKKEGKGEKSLGQVLKVKKPICSQRCTMYVRF